MILIPKPQPGEYAPYTLTYINRLPDDGQVLKYLRENLEATKTFIGAFPAEKLSTPCAPGEWTIKEILVHVSDTERIFAYRALRFARGDTTELSGFEQNEYVPVSCANERDIVSIWRSTPPCGWRPVRCLKVLGRRCSPEQASHPKTA